MLECQKAAIVVLTCSELSSGFTAPSSVVNHPTWPHTQSQVADISWLTAPSTLAVASILNPPLSLSRQTLEASNSSNQLPQALQTGASQSTQTPQTINAGLSQLPGPVLATTLSVDQLLLRLALGLMLV